MKLLRFSRKIDAIRRLPIRPRLAALSQAFAAAGVGELEPLAAELLSLAAARTDVERNSEPKLRELWRSLIEGPAVDERAIADEALRTLAMRWPVLPGRVRETALLVGNRHWPRVLAPIAGSRLPEVRAACAELVGEAQDPALAPILAALARDPDADVAAAAESALLTLCRSAADNPSVDPIARYPLESVVAELARGFPEHRRRPLLHAAAILADPRALASPASPLRQWLDAADDASHLALRAVLRKADDPVLVRRAWRWLSRPSVAAAALDRIAREASASNLAPMLEEWHLLANPARLRLLRNLRLRRAPQQQPAAPVAESLPPNAHRGLPAWLSATGTPDTVRVPTLQAMLGDPDPHARLAAVHGLPASHTADFCFDPDPRVARAAVLRWTRGCRRAPDHPNTPERVQRTRLLAALSRSPHAAVRRATARELERADARDPHTAAGRLAARQHLAHDRDGFLAALRQRIASGPADARVDAITLARRLRLAAEVELELLAALRGEATTSDADPGQQRIAAAAATALAEVPTPSAAAAVRACVGHPIDRVRANAVEGIAVRAIRTSDGASATPMLVELKADPNHRVRANAVRGLMLAASGAEDATHELDAMLADTRVMHRVAALWLAGRTLGRPATAPGSAAPWARTATQIAVMARNDEEPGVRARAAEVSRRLLANLRFGWRGRAIAVDPAGAVA